MKHLDLHEFESLVRELLDDLQREANQWILKRDVHAAAASLAGKEAVERLQHRVIARAFSLGETAPPEETRHVKPFPIPAAPARRKRVKVAGGDE